MTIKVETQGNPRVLETKEEAMSMICRTAYFWSMTHEELKSFDEVQRVAQHFGIDTDNVIIKINPNQEERDEQGFTYVYSFNE